MARPSVKKERTEEILQAFERCAAQYGIEASTLERLAKESGLQRSLIRHYVGNRDDLIRALLKRFIKASTQQTKSLLNSLPDKNRARVMIDYLFDDNYSDRNYALVANALFSAAASIPYLAKPLRQSVDDFIHAIAQLLSETHPNSQLDTQMTIANGIVGLYFNVESMDHLGDTRSWRQAARSNAHLLLNSLD